MSTSRICLAIVAYSCTFSVLLVGAAEPGDTPDYVAGKLIVFNDNGAWSWYSDERVIVDPVNGTLLVGSVANRAAAGGAERHGNVEVVTYRLEGGTPERFVLNERMEADDHDIPALLIRPDGRYLAMYGKHNTDKLTRWRISTKPHDASQWEPEQKFDWAAEPASIGRNNATYANVYHLADEKKTYCFVRAVNRDHSILSSTDDGSTWAYVGKLLVDQNVGYVNGYVKYASDGKKRIHFITTEHHPRDFNNSIFHGYIEGGKLHKSDGTVVDENILDSTAPKPTDLTTVFAANSEVGGEKMTRCWTTDIELDRQGNPFVILTCRANDPDNRNINDHRFFYARWDGSKWQTHQLAKAGPRLWNSEQDYTGLVALHPQNPDVLYISTPIDPRDDKKLAHHEIFKGVTSDRGATWKWTPITANSTVDNLRPIIPAWQGDKTALLWFRGTMRRSQDYDSKVVGIIEQK